jgi:hypothetical protein
VHIGDVIVHPGDLFGDGVNIASGQGTLKEPPVGSCDVKDAMIAEPEVEI